MTHHPTDRGTLENEIRAAHTTWIETVNAGDLDRLLTLATDDAVFVNPGQPPFGRAGLSAGFTAASEQSRFRCVSELEEVVVAGDVAYTRAKDALSLTPRAGGATARFAGYRLTIYRKQVDGRWLLARDAHTLLPV